MVQNSKVTKLPQTGWFRTREAYYLTVLETRSPRSRCLRGWYLLKTARGKMCSTPFSWFLMFCWELLPVSKFPLCIRRRVILDSGPTLLLHDLIFTNYICSDPISKFHPRTLTTWILWITIQPITDPRWKINLLPSDVPKPSRSLL